MHTELHDRLEDLFQPYRGRVSFAEFLKMLIGRMEARYGSSPGKEMKEKPSGEVVPITKGGVHEPKEILLDGRAGRTDPETV